MEGLKNFTVYIDELLIQSQTHEEHLDLLDKVSRRLAEKT